jgi:hypothetical protein
VIRLRRYRADRGVMPVWREIWRGLTPFVELQIAQQA